MKIKSLFLGISLFVLGAAAHAGPTSKMVCFNKGTTGRIPFKLALKGNKSKPFAAKIGFKDATCSPLKQIEYNPVSAKYEGWIRVGTPNDDCADVGQALFGESSIFHKPIRVYWISISREVQKGKKGFIQIGFENDADPGAGPEAKVFLGCIPAKKD